jgi:hypothetical protein
MKFDILEVKIVTFPLKGIQKKELEKQSVLHPKKMETGKITVLRVNFIELLNF